MNDIANLSVEQLEAELARRKRADRYAEDAAKMEQTTRRCRTGFFRVLRTEEAIIDAIRANADKLKGRWLGLEELMHKGDVICNFQSDFEARQTPEALRGAYMTPGGWTGCPRSVLYGRHPVFRPEPTLETQLKNLRNS